MEMVLGMTLGKDWRKLFNLVISNVDKQDFFNNKNTSFNIVGDNKIDIKEGFEIKDDNLLTYLHGNYDIFTEFIRMRLGKKEPRIAFFGDDIVNDCYYANQCPGWDGIAIVESMCYASDYSYVEEKTGLTPLESKKL